MYVLLRGIDMSWEVKISGNMTLLIIEGKRIVARVDMLSQNTLKSGDDGNRLCRAMNDLTLISDAVNSTEIVLTYENGLSPLPWKAIWSEKRYVIKDAEGRVICSRSISANTRAKAETDFQAISIAIDSINSHAFGAVKGTR